MEQFSPDLVLDGHATLGESPVWDGDALLWVDIQRGELHRLDLSGRDEVLVACEESVAHVALTQEGGVTLAVGLEIRRGGTEPIAALPSR